MRLRLAAIPRRYVPRTRYLAREVLDGSDTASLGPVDPERGLPFRPSSFRDCSLWEQDQVAAARGLLHMNGGTASRAVTVYERLRQQPFPRLRPRPLWHERPLYYKGASAAWLADGDTARGRTSRRHWITSWRSHWSSAGQLLTLPPPTPRPSSAGSCW